jgi:hypothetical protein
MTRSLVLDQGIMVCEHLCKGCAKVHKHPTAEDCPQECSGCQCPYAEVPRALKLNSHGEIICSACEAELFVPISDYVFSCKACGETLYTEASHKPVKILYASPIALNFELSE